MLRRAMTSTVLIVSLVAVAACTVDGTPVPVGADATQQPQVPETAAAAGTAPGARTLMARIRAADPCLGLDQTYPRRFGSVVRETQQKAQDLTACQVVASNDPGTPQVRFRVTLGTDLAVQDRVGMITERVGSHTVFREPRQNPESNSCAYRIRSRTAVSVQQWRSPGSSRDAAPIRRRGHSRAQA